VFLTLTGHAAENGKESDTERQDAGHTPAATVGSAR
jgi:hypothetical protein